jgi:AcrR family transcriptional regulator
MPVADISLNELSRRVGLAKSNVLRYFDSREAVLLELLASSVQLGREHLAAELPSAVNGGRASTAVPHSWRTRSRRSLAERPVLCDLMSTQAAVLERNVSVEAVTQHKLAGLAEGEAIAGLVRDALPELSEDEAWQYLMGVWLMTAALWAHARPPEALLEAYAADERLERAQLDFAPTLQDYLTTLAIGLTRAAERSSLECERFAPLRKEGECSPASGATAWSTGRSTISCVASTRALRMSSAPAGVRLVRVHGLW